jgi:hypothetical protein
MRGTIEMRSIVGYGTTVTVMCTLPLAQSFVESPISPFDSDVYSWKSSTKAKDEVKILIAEDNALNQQIAVRSLKKMGFQCTAVSNGSEALEAVTSTQYEIVLMDCQMVSRCFRVCSHRVHCFYSVPYLSERIADSFIARNGWVPMYQSNPAAFSSEHKKYPDHRNDCFCYHW